MYSIVVNGQEIAFDDTMKMYIRQEVIELDSIIDAKEMQSGAIQWIHQRFNSGNDVIQLNDFEQEKIIVKGNFPTSMFMKKGWINFVWTLEFKDNKFRSTFTNLSYFSSGSGQINFESSMIGKKKVISNANENITNCVAELTKFLMNYRLSNDDW